MPWVDKGTRSIIQQWQRCRDRGALPEDGGLFDQPESIMTAFDVIDQVVVQHKQQKAEDMERSMAQDETVRRLERGRY
jgi:hypothetical protein